MPFDYITTEEAISRPGLRMVVVSGVPSPWGEAAKGILHVKGIDWAAVRLDPSDEAQRKWAKGTSGPIAVLNDERPRSGWAEILLMAERIAPEPALLPVDLGDRALAMGLAHEIMGEGGLCWTRRVEAVAAGLAESGAGFHPKVAAYLAAKYGCDAGEAQGATARIVGLLNMLAERLKSQPGGLYFGDRLTAVDIYSAAAMALFAPLPEAQCAMNPATRRTFETVSDEIAAALDPVLIAHRDRIYADWLETPLSL